MRTRIFPVLLVLFLVSVALPAAAQTLADFEKSVTEFTLANGMKFVVVERRAVPVASFFLHADVGAVDEQVGQSGLAHMFEHMAFKGTSKIGTKDFKKERLAMARVDQAYAAWAEERHKGERADAEKLKQLEAAFQQAQAEADKQVESNEFSIAIEENGGVGLNAGTGSDETVYFFSLPSNKMELWFSLESARFLDAVLREFYKERNVVMEERRLRIESQPIGKLIEEFLSVAYKAHPYGRGGGAFFPRLLPPAQPDGGHRRRRGCEGSRAAGQALLRPHPRRPRAGASVDGRAGAGRRAPHHGASPVAAHPAHRLSQAQHPPRRQRRFRRRPGHPVERPHLALLPQPGAGEEAGGGCRRLPRLPRRQVPEPLPLFQRGGGRQDERGERKGHARRD